MGIFDRIGRLARSEVGELKRVLREGRERDDSGLPGGPGPLDRFEVEEREHQRNIAEAEAELARDDHDALSAEIEAGASVWGSPSAAPATATAGDTADPEVARGAELWGAEPAGDSGHTARANPKAGRVDAFTRDVREAYAALELPLGADKVAIETAYRALTLRFHPDRHAQSAHLQQAATELTIRIREARDLLLAWLDGA